MNKAVAQVQSKSTVFSAVDIERSARLHAVFAEVSDRTRVDADDTKGPPFHIFLSPDVSNFKKLLARSHLYDLVANRMHVAQRYALNITNGVGGDKFQHFIARTASWSKTPGAREAASIEAYRLLWMQEFGLDLVGLLLPIYSEHEGRAILLFKWAEDDLASATNRPETCFMACLLSIVKPSVDLLSSIRESLHCTPQQTFCELLPRKWITPVSSFLSNQRKAVRFADEIPLSYEEVEKFADKARFFYESFAIIDGKVFADIDKKETV